jgi:hypothetical protein
MAFTHPSQERGTLLRSDVHCAHEVNSIFVHRLRSPTKLAANRAKPIKIRKGHTRNAGIELQYSL